MGIGLGLLKVRKICLRFLKIIGEENRSLKIFLLLEILLIKKLSKKILIFFLILCMYVYFFSKKKRIYTDSGRCMRPLFIVENAKNKKLCINKENLRTITK
jgi:hypothetical protein